MDHLHSLLQRQIKRYLKNIDSMPDEFIDFLNFVSEAYKQFDDDRELLERSLEFSSEELLDANLELRALLSSLPDLIFIIDLNGEILDCKGGFDSDLIILRKSYIGKNILDNPDKEINDKFKEAVSKVSASGTRTSVEYILNIGGSERFYEARFIRLDNNKIIVVIKNLTERKKTEEILQNNYFKLAKKSTFESIISTISKSVHNSANVSEIMKKAVDTIFYEMVDVDHVSIFSVEGDKAILQHYKGYTESFLEKVKVLESPKGATWSCINERKSILINDVSKDNRLGQAALEEGTKSYLVTPVILNNRPIGCIHLHSRKVGTFDEDDLTFIENLANEISVAINTSLQADAVRKSEERYRTLFDQSPYGICIIDREMKIIHCNQIMADIFGSGLEDIMGLDLNYLKDKSFVPVIERAFQGEICNHTTYYEASTSDAKLWLRAKIVPLYDKDENDVAFVMGVVEDISDRKEAENKLKDNEERFRGIVEHTSDLIIEADIEGKFLYISPNALKLFGYSEEEMIGTSLFEKIHPDDLAAAIKEFSGTIQEMRPGSLTMRYMHKNGEWRWINASGHPYKTSSGEVRSAIAAQDITDMREAENHLRDSEELFRGIVEHTTDLIVETDIEGKFVYISPNCEKVLGYTQSELIGKSIFELVHPDDLAAAIKEFSSAIQDMREGGLITRYKHKDESWRWLDASGKPYKRSNNEIRAVISATDITEKRDSEEKEIQSQKLESLSVLAGGIAHDFNNILTIVISNLSLAEMHLEGNSEVTEIISSAQRASLRASDLTNQLRTFAKGSSMIKQPMLLNKFLKNSVQFALTGSNATNEFDLTDDVLVDIDENQISQVLNNLIINAKQAMPNGGLIRINTEKVKIEGNSSINLEPGDYVKISIIDNGVGIKSEDLSKIFDPYFSTKEKGSGLGLATSFSIIHKHGGQITVSSVLGEGTQCNVYLPCKSEKYYKKHRLSNNNEIVQFGRLLLMDDEVDIVETLSLMLNKIGYEVDSVSNGEEAVSAYCQALGSDKSYSAVILDLTIPGGMGGVETVKKLKEIDPDAYCIVSSGYSADPVIEQYKEFGFRDCLNKPFSVQKLKEVLHKIQELGAT